MLRPSLPGCADNVQDRGGFTSAVRNPTPAVTLPRSAAALERSTPSRVETSISLSFRSCGARPAGRAGRHHHDRVAAFPQRLERHCEAAIDTDRTDRHHPVGEAVGRQDIRPHRRLRLGAQPPDALGRVVAVEGREVDARERLQQQAAWASFLTVRRPGRPGWVRSSAWHWLFSSQHMTSALSGGLR